MSGTPTVSRNDVAAAGSNNFQHQQQQGPLQQRPLLTSSPTHGSSTSPVRHYSNHPVPESSNININQPVDYQGSNNGSHSNSNGYTINFNSASNHNNRDSTSDRQRSVMTQQQTMAPNQMTTGTGISPYHLAGETPSCGNQSSFPVSGGASDNTQTTGSTSSNTSTESPSRSQHHHNTNTMGQLMASPQQQAMQMSNHQHHPMNIQQQQQQQFHQQQQQYQLYPQLKQQDSNGTLGNIDMSTQAQHPHATTSAHQRLDDNQILNRHNMNSEVQFQRSSPSKQTSASPMYLNKQSNSNKNTGSSNVDQLQMSTESPLFGSTLNAGTPATAPNASTKVLSATKMNSPNTIAESNNASSNNSSNKVASSNGNSASAPASASTIPPLPPEKVVALLSRCTWVDKTVWASRQLLGGQAVNGFMRATATVQRIKKQRARQNVKSGKSKVTATATAPATGSSNTASAASADVGGGGDNMTVASSSTSNAAPTQSLEEQQAEEDILKTEIMNSRTAKKIKQELDGGIQFCVLLHDTIRSIIQQMDPSITPPEPLSSSSFANRCATQSKPANVISALPTVTIENGNATTVLKQGTKHQGPGVAKFNNTMANSKSPIPTMQHPLKQNHGTSGSPPSHFSQSNATGSTLRRHRRTKHSPSGEVLIQLPEIDEVTGKRQSTKKGQPHRLSDVIRFRSLRQGDPVAARLTSRDLWILARVMKDYPGTNLTPIEFLRLSDSRREQLFKEKVLIQDVEEHDGGAAAAVWVSRSLVLPLPRNVSEAAEWGNYYRFYKKGSRVYAMYPQTTALYTATVVDCNTYCRREEDIIVVEFDGDEPDPATGKLPACHIPARFVTLIPKEFPGSQAPAGTGVTGTSSSTSTSSNKRKRNPIVDNSIEDVDIMNGVLDDLNFDGDLPGLDQFDDLDFDLLGDG